MRDAARIRELEGQVELLSAQVEMLRVHKRVVMPAKGEMVWLSAGDTLSIDVPEVGVVAEFRAYTATQLERVR